MVRRVFFLLLGLTIVLSAVLGAVTDYPRRYWELLWSDSPYAYLDLSVPRAPFDAQAFIDGFQLFLRPQTLLLAGGGLLLVLALWGWRSRARSRRAREEVFRMMASALDRSGSEQTTAQLQDLEGVLQRMSTTLVDLSDRDQQRRELIANVTHDLLKPVAAIRAYLETIQLQKDQISEEELERYIATVLRNTKSVDQLVSEFLDLSKLDGVQREVRSEPFSLTDLAGEVYMKLRPKADARNVSIAVRAEPDLPLAIGDAALIERALSNLLDNAVSYTLPGGAVAVTIFRAESRVLVRIDDTGIGVASEELPLIFEPLYRAQKDPLEDPGGNGLGLAITLKIVEAHGSQLFVDSRLGEGTSFVFGLEAAAQPAFT